ncbi:hypothetical protein CQA61_30285, partial [Klebsiella pneumoniae]
TQGFSLPLSRWRRRPESDPALAFAFYPQAAGDPVATQGFSLPLSRWRRRPESDPALAFAFYPQAAGD